MLVVLTKLIKDLFRLFNWKLDEQTFVGFDIKGRNKQVRFVSRDLYQIKALPELLAALIEHYTIFV